MKATEILSNKSTICREVLDDLPEWFGIPSAKENYASSVAALPMFGCHNNDEPVAFVSLKQHTRHAVEMYVLGGKRRYHGQDLGRALFEATLHFAA